MYETNHPQEHYYYPSSSSSLYLHSPHYISLEDETLIFHELSQLQQEIFSSDHDHQNTIIDNNTSHVKSAIEEDRMRDGGDEHLNMKAEPPNKMTSSRKRSCKKDRHSKINTARGPRDRRMRLSLDVAKKFFGLQDKLGFDKASKTVEWLLTKSKLAIRELLPHRSSTINTNTNTNSASSTSECEVLSGIYDQSMAKKNGVTKDKAKSSSKRKLEKKKNGRRGAHDLHHPLAKETRERARARARERTIEKRNITNNHVQNSNFIPRFYHQEMDQEARKLGPWSSLEENQVEFQFKQATHVGDTSSANWSPSFLFSYHHNAGLSADQHQFNDFQILGKPWEGNNY